MQEFFVSAYPQLNSVGSCMPLKGTLADATSYEYASMHLQIPAGISYDLTLSNTGEAIVLMGSIHAHVIGECARCLQEAKLDIDTEVQGYYLQGAAGGAEGKNTDISDAPTENVTDGLEDIAAEEIVGYVDKSGNIDLSDAILAALIYATPYVVICKSDCKGLCPKCGANLNECPDHNHDDEIDPSNPFAFLKDYKFREG